MAQAHWSWTKRKDDEIERNHLYDVGRWCVGGKMDESGLKAAMKNIVPLLHVHTTSSRTIILQNVLNIENAIANFEAVLRLDCKLAGATRNFSKDSEMVNRARKWKRHAAFLRAACHPHHREDYHKFHRGPTMTVEYRKALAHKLYLGNIRTDSRDYNKVKVDFKDLVQKALHHARQYISLEDEYDFFRDLIDDCSDIGLALDVSSVVDTWKYSHLADNALFSHARARMLTDPLDPCTDARVFYPALVDMLTWKTQHLTKVGESGGWIEYELRVREFKFDDLIRAENTFRGLLILPPNFT